MFLLTLESPQTLRAARRGIEWMREHYRRPPEPQRARCPNRVAAKAPIALLFLRMPFCPATLRAPSQSRAANANEL